MFWFTGGIVEDEDRIPDANAGTFYSAMSNVNITIEDGNPYAVALRTHYAQHSFVSHVAINIGKGRAGMFEIGNEMEDLAFYGGDYGIMATKASPGWQVMMVDACFEGQRKAAVKSQESGLAIVNMQVKNVPMVFDIEDNYWEKIFIENARFENISGPAFNIAVENNSNNSITLRNVWCSNVPVLAAFSGFGTPVAVLESSKGSDDNILNGIGISTGAFNYRAVGLKWTAGSGSYVNDVKFIGGHGSMWKPVAGQKAPRWSWGPREVSTPDKPVREQVMDQAWDSQYWSLWVTDGGGGIFKDIWTANTYASNGFYAENTSTEGRIYAMSIEHHVRNEVRFRNVSNWKVYCMQTEEETVESSECQPV